MLDKIVRERDSFKASPTKGWLLDQLKKAWTAYSVWRQGLLQKPRCAGAIKWVAGSVAELITLVNQVPDMEDPILIGVSMCNLPIVGRPNTRRARHMRNAGNAAADDSRAREADAEQRKRQRKAAVAALAEPTRRGGRTICGTPNQASQASAAAHSGCRATVTKTDT